MHLSLLIILVSVVVLVGVITFFFQLRRSIKPEFRPTRLGKYPSISVIRPIKGLDSQAEQNIRAAFNHGYPGDTEILFILDDKSDPAYPLVKSILEENPPDRFTISDKLWEGHKKRTQRNLKRGTGFTAFEADLEKPSNTIVARYGKDGKECLIPQSNKNPRMLTPRECARLQGYPEEFNYADNVTAAYKQFGNSVAVPVVQKIAENIIMHLS